MDRERNLSSVLFPLPARRLSTSRSTGSQLARSGARWINFFVYCPTVKGSRARQSCGCSLSRAAAQSCAKSDYFLRVLFPSPAPLHTPSRPTMFSLHKVCEALFTTWSQSGGGHSVVLWDDQYLWEYRPRMPIYVMLNHGAARSGFTYLSTRIIDDRYSG